MSNRTPRSLWSRVAVGFAVVAFGATILGANRAYECWREKGTDGIDRALGLEAATVVVTAGAAALFLIALWIQYLELGQHRDEIVNMKRQLELDLYAQRVSRFCERWQALRSNLAHLVEELDVYFGDASDAPQRRLSMYREYVNLLSGTVEESDGLSVWPLREAVRGSFIALGPRPRFPNPEHRPIDLRAVLPTISACRAFEELVRGLPRECGFLRRELHFEVIGEEHILRGGLHVTRNLIGVHRRLDMDSTDADLDRALFGALEAAVATIDELKRENQPQQASA